MIALLIFLAGMMVWLVLEVRRLNATTTRAMAVVGAGIIDELKAVRRQLPGWSPKDWDEATKHLEGLLEREQRQR